MSTSFAAVVLLTAAGSARADWLVTRDGAKIETKGPWKVAKRQVLFTLPNGELSTIRADQVDLDQSALATTRAKEIQAKPVPPAAAKKEPVLRLTDKDIASGSNSADSAEGKPGDAKAAEKGVLEVISWEKTEDSSGDGLEIFGTIKNTGTGIVITPTLLVAIYDADGGLLASNNGDVNSQQIEAGKTANFRVAFPTIPDFAAVKFDPQGRGFQARVANAGVDETEAPEADEPSDVTGDDSDPTPDAEPDAGAAPPSR
ncbi:MAG: FxLYD domain-containing protein [Thermoanaerobaculia bacterium]